MADHILWLHDKYLMKSAIDDLRPLMRPVFIWDDAYFQSRGYTLKRLVFIYETLCDLDIEIFHGPTLDVLTSLAPKSIQVFHSADTTVKALIAQMAQDLDIQVVHPAPFVKNFEMSEYRRFFKYWNATNKSALSHDGGV